MLAQPAPTTGSATNTVFVSAAHKTIGVPATEQLHNLMPHARVVTFEGNALMLLPHGVQETRLLRNFGYDVPAPVASQYDYEGGSPFLVQRKTTELLTCNVRAYVLNGMGTGKTKAALWAWRYLNRMGQAKKALVVAPLSTLNFTWAKEIIETLPGIKCQVLYGDRKKRLAKLADPEADIYVINHDGVSVLFNELSARMGPNGDITCLIIDELAVYRNGAASRTKAMRKLAAPVQWVWGLTGSPTPNAPTDAWAEATIITPSSVPKYFGHFRDRVMTKISQFRYVPKPDSVEQVHRALQPAVRYTLDDVLELPPLIVRPVDVEMGKHQALAYNTMEKEAFSLIQTNEITAMNAGAVLSKLLQISTGWVYTRDHIVVPLDNKARLERLRDDVLSSEKKVLVFVPFTHAMNGIVEFLKKEGIDCRAISGETSHKERGETFNLFQNTPIIHTLVAHPGCMAHGLTLTAASLIIWFAPTTSLDIFDQANARIRRIGQDTRQLILLYQATKAERQMYAKLRAKQKVQNLLLDMFAETSQ